MQRKAIHLPPSLKFLSGQKGTNTVAEKPESMFFGVNDNFQACQNMQKKSLFVIEVGIICILIVCDNVVGVQLPPMLTSQLRSPSTFVSRYNLIFLLDINCNNLVKPLLALLC